MTHLTQEQIQHLKQGNITNEKNIEYLEHISQCEYCANQYANSFLENDLIETPPDLRQNILDETVYKKSALETLQMLERKGHQKKKEFLCFTAKVVFAMCAVTVMLFSTGNMEPQSLDTYVTETNKTAVRDFEQEKKTVKKRDITSQSALLDSVENSSRKVYEYIGNVFQSEKKQNSDNKKEDK